VGNWEKVMGIVTGIFGEETWGGFWG